MNKKTGKSILQYLDCQMLTSYLRIFTMYNTICYTGFRYTIIQNITL